jgi:hypothetical protein
MRNGLYLSAVTNPDRSSLPGQPRPGGEDVQEILHRGLEACRRGDWKEGLRHLGHVSETGESKLPGVFYSYLGYGIALVDRRIRDGVKLAKHGVKIGYHEPDNHLNLARVCLLANDRRGAVKALRDGLKIDPQNAEMRKLRREIGVRSSPVIPFLDRSNPLNVLLGRIRHALRNGK